MKEKILTINQAKTKTGIHYTINHTGKMTGMYSLSTSCVKNKYCVARSQIKDSICSHCYAQRQMKMYKQLEKCLSKNTEILTSRILDNNELPVINALYFRLEAFGDLNNETQLINYFNLCKKNKSVKFALWTKNLNICKSVIENMKINKPKNLNIIFSSSVINLASEPVLNNIWVDKIFTVYDKDFIEKYNIKINCGAENCLSCGRCYKKSKEKFIREKLK